MGRPSDETNYWRRQQIFRRGYDNNQDLSKRMPGEDFERKLQSSRPYDSDNLPSRRKYSSERGWTII